jgi:hypothetical protein
MHTQRNNSVADAGIQLLAFSHVREITRLGIPHAIICRL